MNLFDQTFLAAWLPYAVCLVPALFGIILVTRWELSK